MTALQLAKQLNLEILVEGEGDDREVSGVYCCDLLSIVMGRAKADDAWITVMGNINAIAVALLADVSCIILSENMQLDSEGLEKARQQNICVLKTANSTFDTAMAIANLLK